MFKVNDILEVQKGDQGGRPKNGQNFGWGKKSDILKKGAAQKWPKFNMG